MNSLGGGTSGGGSGGGAIVQTISPEAYGQANFASQVGIKQAQQQYTTGVNDAIKSLQQQYNVAQGFQQPYSASGQQALYQMNYLLGLGAVNPGSAPIKPTLESEAKNVTNSQVQSYINANSGFGRQNNQYGKTYINPTYTGYGTQQGDVGYDALMAEAQRQYNESQKDGFKILSSPTTVGAWGNGQIVGNPTYGGAGPIDAANAFQLSGPGSVYDEARLGVANDALKTSLPAYNTAMGQYTTQNDLYNKYNAMGLATPDQLQGIVAGQPGYQAELGQGLAALNNAGSAGNQLGSGRTLAALSQYGQNTMSKYYGGMLNNLANLAGMGQQSAGVQSSLSSNLGNQIGGLQSGLGTNLGNAAIASGNAAAQAAIGQGTQYQVMGGNSGGSNNSGLGSLLGGAASLLGSSATGGSGLMGLFGGK